MPALMRVGMAMVIGGALGLLLSGTYAIAYADWRGLWRRLRCAMRQVRTHWTWTGGML